MKHTIQNGILTVAAEPEGAQLASLLGPDGTEYLWQGDPAFWSGRAPNLFPYIGRLNEGAYTYRGTRYSLPLHGLAPHLPFSLTEQNETEMAFVLTWDEATLAQYPFRFQFEVRYRLRGNTLDLAYTVKNQGDAPMPFALGAHPGFRVPLTGNHSFESYRVRFPEACSPKRVLFSERGLTLDAVPYALECGDRISLSHALFDQDAIVLEGTPKTVTLESVDAGPAVTVSFPGMNYVGFWHCPRKSAPFLCIEPWSSLPSRDGVTEDLERQPGLLILPAGEHYMNTVTITIH